MLWTVRRTNIDSFNIRWKQMEIEHFDRPIHQSSASIKAIYNFVPDKIIAFMQYAELSNDDYEKLS